MFQSTVRSTVSVGGLTRNLVSGFGQALCLPLTSVFFGQIRTTVILKRQNPLRLNKKGRFTRKLEEKDYIYDLVKNSESMKLPDIQIILTSDVNGIGTKGEMITMKRTFARQKLLLPGLAVYASPENIETNKQFLKDIEKSDYTPHSPYTAKTLKQLSTQVLAVVMNGETPWEIEAWHVRMSFRKAGFVVPEEAITMPKNSIKGPNLSLQSKEFYVEVLVNGRDKMKVRCRLHHLSQPTENEHWRKPSSAIFPEDQEVLDSMPMPPLVSEKKLKQLPVGSMKTSLR